LSREGCKRIIAAAGLPLPHKSRCWQCPHQNQEEWREIRDNPEEWAKAVALDEEVRENDPEQAGLFLHKSRVPLAVADLSDGDNMDTPLLKNCEGACWT
jgi:hypothetical protein